MCLIVKNDYKVITATKDLPIYKVVRFQWDGTFTTKYYESVVLLHEIYSSDLNVLNIGGYLCSIDKTITDSYASKKFVHEGLHAFWGGMDKHLLSKYLYCIIDLGMFSLDRLLAGYILEGSRYILNEDTGLVASNTMVYNEVLDMRNFLI